MMTASLSRAVFESLRDSTFTAELEGRSVGLVLIEVADNTPFGFAGEQFSLTFEGPDQPVLSQSIYALRHTGLGRLDLFLVPTGVTGETRLYEACFSLMPGD